MWAGTNAQLTDCAIVRDPDFETKMHKNSCSSTTLNGILSYIRKFPIPHCFSPYAFPFFSLKYCWLLYQAFPVLAWIQTQFKTIKNLNPVCSITKSRWGYKNHKPVVHRFFFHQNADIENRIRNNSIFILQKLLTISQYKLRLYKCKYQWTVQNCTN